MKKLLARVVIVLGILLVNIANAQFSPAVLPSVYKLLFDSNNTAATNLERVLAAYDNPNSSHIFIAAHRGGKENDQVDQAPGNSIVNIANALSKGFDLYESDIEILKNNTPTDFSDDVLVVFHDDTFDNLTNTTVIDDALDAADLDYAKSLFLTYDNGGVSNQRIPTLEEFLTAAKDNIMVKFDLKNGTFNTTTLIKIFDIVVATQTVEQVLIRGGENLLNVANDNGYDTRMIMRRYDSMPSPQEITDLATNFNLRAISIPNGADSAVYDAANDAGLVVEIHELDGFTDTDRLNAINAGVRQFHTFKPLLLLDYLEQNNYREF